MSAKRMLPEVGTCSVAMQRIKLDLPAPLGPGVMRHRVQRVRAAGVGVAQVLNRQHRLSPSFEEPDLSGPGRANDTSSDER